MVLITNSTPSITLTFDGVGNDITIPVNSPGFAERFPVSIVISRSPGFHLLSPGF